MHATTVALSALCFGHDPRGPNVNARATDRTGALDDLKASIRAHGLIQPLVVRRLSSDDPFTFAVIAGNRRLAALQGLVADEAPEALEEVPVLLADVDEVQALEISLAENVMRLPLHPVDQYEVFAALGTGTGALSEKAIAERFNIARKDVKRALALGNLAQEVRDLWRAGKLHANTAQAFTIAGRDHERQRRVLADLSKRHMLYEHAVREALAPAGGQARGQIAAFVGLEAYKAAGGTVTTDLFSDAKWLSDPALMQRLADEKFGALKAEVLAEGWSWVALGSECERSWEWARISTKPTTPTPEELAELDAIEADRAAPDADLNALNERTIAVRDAQHARAYTDEDRARGGAIIDIGYNGEPRIQRGYVRPEVTKAEAKAAAAEAGQPEGLKPIGAPLAQSLSEQQSAALAEVLAGDRNLAFAVLLATLATEKRQGGSPCCIRANGRGFEPAAKAEWLAGKFPAVLDEARGLSFGEGLDVLADLVAAAIDSSLTARGMNSSYSNEVQPSSLAAVIQHAEPEAWRAAQAKHFDVDAYFASATKAHAIAALEQMHGKNPCASQKKGDIAALAAADAKRLGWLPAELRTVHYDGPGAPKKVAPKKRTTKLREAA